MFSEEEKIRELIQNKNVLYIATKNEDYIRLQQEINLVETNARNYKIIVSNKKNYLARLIDIYVEIFFCDFNDYDIIFVGFMAQMLLPWYKIKFKNKIIITDFFISIYDTLVDDRGYLSNNSMISKFVHWIDSKTIKYSDFIICDTNAHKSYFSSEFDVLKSKLMVLYLKADKRIYFPMNIDKPENLRDKYIVLYFGSILPLQGVDIVLKAIEILKTKKNIHFIMIGPIGKKYDKVQSDTVTYLEWLSQKELAKYIAFSDLCLGGHFSYNIGKANRTIPGKVYIYDAMEKTMILGDSEANKELFNENCRVTFVSRGDSILLANVILESFEEWKHGNKMYFCSCSSL